MCGCVGVGELSFLFLALIFAFAPSRLARLGLCCLLSSYSTLFITLFTPSIFTTLFTTPTPTSEHSIPFQPAISSCQKFLVPSHSSHSSHLSSPSLHSPSTPPTPDTRHPTSRISRAKLTTITITFLSHLSCRFCSWFLVLGFGFLQPARRRPAQPRRDEPSQVFLCFFKEQQQHSIAP